MFGGVGNFPDNGAASCERHSDTYKQICPKRGKPRTPSPRTPTHMSPRGDPECHPRVGCAKTDACDVRTPRTRKSIDGTCTCVGPMSLLPAHDVPADRCGAVGSTFDASLPAKKHKQDGASSMESARSAAGSCCSQSRPQIGFIGSLERLWNKTLK
ncbi:unnamed protein product [Pleuronectes platessa]|uniref:Uncharacterized protein n=1 Tax=Pleuronectes platessa TaxID=8262 RepID=A0A9N7VL80_PLEPL|nr:unnamed protein product [Pleuronectes platessa]